MKLISDDRVQQWCADLGIRLNDNPSAWAPEFGELWRMTAPIGATDAVNLAYVLLMTDVAEYAESNFQGALLWLRRWELWSESVDRVGYQILSGLAGLAHPRWLEERPALQFASDEFIQAHTAVSVALMFQWDAYVLPISGAHVARISHHGSLELAGELRNRNQITERFAQWSPEQLVKQ